MTKKLVPRTRSIYLDGEIDYAIEQLQEAKADGYTRVELTKEWYPYEHEPTYLNQLTKMEPETDQEYDTRLKQEATWAEQQAERDRREFERLRSIFAEHP